MSDIRVQPEVLALEAEGYAAVVRRVTLAADELSGQVAVCEGVLDAEVAALGHSADQALRVLGISDASQLLGAAPDADLEMLGHILARARENWRHPVYERDLRDEPQPFTVVLQDTEAGLRLLASRAPAFHGLLEQLP